MINLSEEFSLCDRAAEIGMPFVPDGWEYGYSDHDMRQWQTIRVPERIPSTADIIDAASWRDAASEWLEQFDLRVKRVCHRQNGKITELGEWIIVRANSLVWNLEGHEERHPAFLAAVEFALKEKQTKI